MGLILRLAWRNVWRQTRRSLLTASAMGFGVALCMFYLCLADGMFTMMFDVVVGKQIGHAQVHAPAFPKTRALYETVDDAANIEAKLQAHKDVKLTVGRVYGYGLLGVKDEAKGAQLMGILPSAETAFRGLGDKVIEGTYLDNKPNMSILLGHKLAKEMKAKVGDEVVVVTSAADGSMGNELFKVVGLVKTGATAIDKGGALIHRADAQDLFALGDGVHELAVVGHNQDGIDAAVAATRTILDDKVKAKKLLVRSWGEVNPQMFEMLSMQDALVGIAAFLIFIVAALGILNTMLMNVFERTKELGVMIAVGLRPWQVMLLVLVETGILAVVAVALGLVFGGLGDWYLVTQGIDWGVALDFGGVSLDPVIKGVVRPSSIVSIVFLVFVISMMAALWPAWRASRVQPVVAMREQ